MNRILFFALAAVLLAGAGTLSGYWLASQRTASAPQPTAEAAKPGGKRILYYHDPMHPEQKFDKPGKSPFMDMQLEPVYAEGEGDAGGVAISSRIQENLGVRTAEAVAGTLTAAVDVVGSVAYNERDLVLVQARSNGFVEKLFVRAPLDAVKKGQVLAELYVPEWVATQEEYLSLRRATGQGLDALVDGAKSRMRQAGMSEAQIQLIETTGKVQPRTSVTAPIAGVVAELGAREGMTVASGAMLFRINSLGTVWVNAEVPESQAGLVRVGSPVTARTSALPGTVFKGRVSAILPEVNAVTRTLKARIELANPGALLVPGMFASVSFAPVSGKEMLLVPTEAVIATGTRSVVIVEMDAGRFAQVDVETGAEAMGKTEIRKGLRAGQKVVVSGQFLIDSEASLKATANRMSEAPAGMRGDETKTGAAGAKP